MNWNILTFIVAEFLIKAATGQECSEIHLHNKTGEIIAPEWDASVSEPGCTRWWLPYRTNEETLVLYINVIMLSEQYAASSDYCMAKLTIGEQEMCAMKPYTCIISNAPTSHCDFGPELDEKCSAKIWIDTQMGAHDIVFQPKDQYDGRHTFSISYSHVTCNKEAGGTSGRKDIDPALGTGGSIAMGVLLGFSFFAFLFIAIWYCVKQKSKRSRRSTKAYTESSVTQVCEPTSHSEPEKPYTVAMDSAAPEQVPLEHPYDYIKPVNAQNPAYESIHITN